MTNRVVCHNTLDWTGPVNTNILREINDAMGDTRPIENIASLTSVELWHTTKNPIWIRVWLELNGPQYDFTQHLVDDMVEVFKF